MGTSAGESLQRPRTEAGTPQFPFKRARHLASPSVSLRGSVVSSYSYVNRPSEEKLLIYLGDVQGGELGERESHDHIINVNRRSPFLSPSARPCPAYVPFHTRTLVCSHCLLLCVHSLSCGATQNQEMDSKVCNDFRDTYFKCLHLPTIGTVRSVSDCCSRLWTTAWLLLSFRRCALSAYGSCFSSHTGLITRF